MFDIDKLMGALDSIAPLSLSKAMIDKGDYDNSGLIIKCGELADNVTFALDLSQSAVRKAVRNKSNVIVTHHPAIYTPIKSLSVDDTTTAPIISAIKNGVSVISMHLNLDVADGGIDACLCEGLGGDNYKILDPLTELNGYGREFSVPPVTLGEFVNKVKTQFSTRKIVVYGNRKTKVKKVASFCGGGSSVAEKCVTQNLTDADLIITSDMPHHVIKTLLEKGKNIMILPHYVAEEYGFNKFYKRASELLKSKAQTYYFDDKRFR